jgi:hypothetical protein
MTILRQIFKANAIYWRLSSSPDVSTVFLLCETKKPFHLSWCIFLRCVVLCCAVLYCVVLRCAILGCVVALYCCVGLLWCEQVPMPALPRKRMIRRSCHCRTVACTTPVQQLQFEPRVSLYFVFYSVNGRKKSHQAWTKSRSREGWRRTLTLTLTLTLG